MFNLENDIAKAEENYKVWLVERHNDFIKFLTVLKNEEFNEKLIKELLVDFPKYFSLAITEKAIFSKKLKQAKREYELKKAKYISVALDEGMIAKKDTQKKQESYIKLNTDIDKYIEKVDFYENIVSFLEDSMSMLRNVPIQEMESVYRLEKKL